MIGVANCGRDDTNTLKLAADLKLNSVSVISGEVSISGVSGEAGRCQLAPALSPELLLPVTVAQA